MQRIPFIDLFKSALHVSGDKLAHPQEHFLTVYAPIGTVQCTDIAAGADLKRSINGIRCILSVAYIVILMMHALTNIKIWEYWSVLNFVLRILKIWLFFFHSTIVVLWPKR